MPSLRVGLIGLGKIGRVHLDHLTAMQNVEVVAIVDEVQLRDVVIPNTAAVFNNWQDCLSKIQLDAVIISLPHALHAPCAEAALANGIHVFIEKPLATTLNDAERLVQRAQELDRTLMVNMTHRFYPPLRKARKLLATGAIGKVISVRDYCMEIIDPSDFPPWFFDPVIAGGGVAITDSIHLIDRVAWLLGESLRFIGGVSRSMIPETSVEDCAEILCDTKAGVPVTIGSFFFNGPRAWDDGLTLFGTEGVMKVGAWSHVEWGPYGQPSQQSVEFAPDMPPVERVRVGHRASISEFVDALRENRKPEADAKSVLNAQEIVERFYHFTAGQRE